MKSIISLSRNYVMLFMGILLFIVFAGCGKKSKAQNQITIGVSYQDLQNEFVIRLQDAIRAEAKKLNIKLIELDGQGKAERQIAQVENFINRKVNAIILNPEDEYGSAPAVDIAMQHHTPIVVVNALVSNLDKANAYVGSPDSIAGVMEATKIMQLLKGKGNVVLIQGPYGHSAEVQRTEGVKAVFAKYPQAKIVAEQTANWDRAQAMTLMENWLSTGHKINAVIAENDEMAMGALGSIEGAGKRKILIIGIDAIHDALRAVKEGKMVATIYQDANAQGSMAVKLADNIIKGQKVKHLNYIPFQLVTKANVAKFLKRVKDNE
jgi:inositol transport system substrate-binding protein